MGWALIVTGLVLAAAVQLTSPLEPPPLYDGVNVIEPYLWLSPPPGHPGGAQGASATLEVDAGQSALLAVSTPELTPQAQVFGTPGSLVISPDARAIEVSIVPVPAPASPADGYIDGNVYRIELIDDAGRVVTARPDAQVSVVLRPADETLLEATIERYDGAAWQPLDTGPTGVVGFLAVVTEFGHFAVVGHGESPYATPSPIPTGEPSLAPSAPPASPSRVPSPSGGPAPSTEAGGPAVAVVAVAIAALVGLGALLLWRRRRTYDGPRGWGP